MSDEEAKSAAAADTAKEAEEKPEENKINQQRKVSIGDTTSDEDDTDEDSVEAALLAAAISTEEEQKLQNNDVANDSENEDYEEQLSMSQTETLLHYQQISGLELPQCRRQLEQVEWDLMRATDRLFGGSVGQMQQHEQHNSSSSNSSGAAAAAAGIAATSTVFQRRSAPAPPPMLASDSRARLVTAAGPGSGGHPRPGQAPMGWLGWLESIVMLPFRFFGHSVGSLLRFVLSILRPAAVAAAPRRPVVDPVGDVRQFVEQFEQQYGEQHPPVRVCSYSQALDSTRSELRFLLVYLHAESHQDTDQFCRQVLVSEVFSAFLQASGINFWMCSVSSPEGARVSQALRETGYPFLALIVLKQGRMTVVARFEGLLSLEQLLAELDAAVIDFEPYLTEERARRQSLEMNRRLVEEQDQAYAEALARDREREQRRQAEEAERSAERDASERRREERERELARVRDLLPPEPSAEQDGPASTVKLSVRLPGVSDRLERRFRLSEPVRHLHYFVQLQPAAPERFSLCTSYPKRVLPVEGTFEQAGLTQAEVLFVTDDDE